MNLRWLLLIMFIGLFLSACRLTALISSSQEEPTEIVDPTIKVQATNALPTIPFAVAVVQPTVPIQPSITTQTQPTHAPATSSPTSALKQAAAPTSTATARTNATSTSTATPRAIATSTSTATPRATATSTRANTSTSTPKSTATATATTKTGCVSNAPQAQPSIYIKSVTLALDSSATNPKTTFSPNSTIHAVIATQDAPANTKVKAKWYAIDVGSVAPCNTLAGEAELTEIVGTTNLDFQQGPIAPVGSYRVEIYVNNTLDRVVTFTIK